MKNNVCIKISLSFVAIVCFFLISACNEGVKLSQGEWQGSPSVSFSVGENNVVRAFKISVPLAMGKCDLEIPEFEVAGSGEISISHPKEFFSMTGKVVSPEQIEGKINIKICPDPEDKNNVVMLVPWEKDWNAGFKG